MKSLLTFISKIVLLNAIMIAIGGPVIAQDHREQFDNFKQSQSKEYNLFVEEADKEFAEFLKNNWQIFNVRDSHIKESKPKPEQFPTADNPIKDSKELQAKPLQPQKLNISTGLTMPVNHKTRTYFDEPVSRQFEFFGQTIKIDHVPELSSVSIDKVDPDNISDFWQNISELDYSITLNDLYFYNDLLKLNDYGYYLLIKEFAARTTDSENSADLITWFLLNKSKFKSKIGYNSSKIYLLLPTAGKIYGTSYFTEDDLTYYVMDFDGEQLYSYQGNYSKSYKVLDMAITRSLELPENTANKTVSFAHKGEEFAFNFTYNKNAIEFYKSIPQLDLSSYFNSHGTTHMRESILENLQPVIADMTEMESISFLLDFVQNGFGYKVDQDQFGSEKVFFPEEILFYPFSDCEDRSIFFAYLVTSLVGNDVVGLDYPEHVAIGVHFTDDVPGDYYMFNGKKYIVCDPTYVNAPIGVSMKDLTATPAEIISSTDQNYSLPVISSIKKLFGINGDPKAPKVIEVNSGKVLAANYSEDIFIQNTELKADGSAFFIASFGPGNSLKWAQKIDANQDNGLLNFKVDEESNTYVLYASIENEIRQLHLSKFDNTGNISWHKQIPGINPVFENANTQVVLYSNSGDRLAGKTYVESEFYEDESLKIYEDKIMIILPIEEAQ